MRPKPQYCEPGGPYAQGQTHSIIQGHPDPDEGRFCRALARAYAGGAESAGHSIRWVNVATLKFPMARTQSEFESGTVPTDIAEAQQAIDWAEHLLLIYPLWLGTMPAMLKAFLEQTFRSTFAFAYRSDGRR